MNTVTTERRIRRRTDHIAIILQGITGLAAVIALIVSLASLETRLNNLETARVRARYDSCELIRGLFIVLIHDSPRNKRGAGITFLNHTQLADCQRYSHEP